MAWWVWLVLGIALAGAELFMDAIFYLVFLGLSAVLVSLVVVAVPGLSLSIQFILFTGFALTSFILFRRRLYRYVRGPVEKASFDSTFLGEQVEVKAALGPSERGKVGYRGSLWDAENTSDAETIDEGAKAIIVGIDSMRLLIKPLQRRSRHD